MENQPDDPSIRHRFSSAAPTYDAHAEVQCRVAEELLGLLNAEPPPLILELGCGTGQLTGKLAERFPDVEIHAVDVSRGMLREARSKVPSPATVRWIEGDIGSLEFDSRYPLVTSSSALHWCAPLADAFSQADRCLVPGGQFLSSIMLHGTFQELHQSRLHVAPGKPPHSQLPRFDEVLRIIENLNWELTQAYQETLTSRHDDARSFLRAIHAQGLTGGAVSQSWAPLSRTELDALSRHYQSRFIDAGGKVFATYEVGFFVARKPLSTRDHHDYCSGDG